MASGFESHQVVKDTPCLGCHYEPTFWLYEVHVCPMLLVY